MARNLIQGLLLPFVLLISMNAYGDYLQLDFTQAVGESEEQCELYAQKKIRRARGGFNSEDVNCIGGNCEYVTEYADPEELVENIGSSTFEKRNFSIPPSQGYLYKPQGQVGRKIKFYHQDPCTLAKMIFYAKFWDKKVTVRPPKEITTVIQVYALSESSIRELSIGTTGILDGILTDADGNSPEKGSASGFDESGNAGFSLAFGNLTADMFKVNIKSGKHTDNVSEFRTIKKTQEQCDRESAERQGNRYRDGVTSSQSEKIGWDFSTRPCLVEGDDSRAYVPGFRLTYSRPTGNGNTEIADVLEINTSFQAIHGKPRILIGDTIENILNGRSLDILGLNWGKRSNKLQSKIVVLMTVYLPGLPKTANLPFPTMESLGLNPETELAKSMTVTESLDALVGAVDFEPVNDSANGFDVVRMTFNDKLINLMAKNTYKERIKIKITGDTYPRKGRTYPLALQNVVLGGFQFPLKLIDVKDGDTVDLKVVVERDRKKKKDSRAEFEIRYHSLDKTVEIVKSQAYRVIEKRK